MLRSASLGALNAPGLITLMGLAAGLAVTLRQPPLTEALLLLALAAVADFLDGQVARRLGLASRAGAALDSLADLVSFGVAPAVVLVCLDVPSALAGLHTLAVAMRLSASLPADADDHADPDAFHGLPAPAAALGGVGAAVCLGPWAAVVPLLTAAALLSDRPVRRFGIATSCAGALWAAALGLSLAA